MGARAALGRESRETTEGSLYSSGVLSSNRRWFGLATVITHFQSLAGQSESAPPPRPLDRQGWSTLVAGALLLLISFTTNYGNDNIFQFCKLPAHEQIGMGLHLAALAALAGDAQLATRVRHRAANEAAED